MQPVIAGSADFGAGVGVAGVMRAFERARRCASCCRCSPAPATSTGTCAPIRRSSRSRTRPTKHTIAYSTNGSTSHNIVLAFVSDLGVKAKPTATGGPPATFTAVMSGQIDIGWSAPPFGLQEEKDGKIRIIGRGSDANSLHGQTIRVLIVNADTLKNRKDAVLRFVARLSRGGRLDVFEPGCAAALCREDQAPEALIKKSIAKYHTKDAMQTDAMKDIDGIMRDAVKLKFLDKPLTKEQLTEFIQIPPR